MIYSPALDARLSYEHAIAALRSEYLLTRQWVYELGRWESAEEWLERRNG